MTRLLEHQPDSTGIDRSAKINDWGLNRLWLKIKSDFSNDDDLNEDEALAQAYQFFWSLIWPLLAKENGCPHPQEESLPIYITTNFWFSHLVTILKQAGNESILKELWPKSIDNFEPMEGYQTHLERGLGRDDVYQAIKQVAQWYDSLEDDAEFRWFNTIIDIFTVAAQKKSLSQCLSYIKDRFANLPLC